MSALGVLWEYVNGRFHRCTFCSPESEVSLTIEYSEQCQDGQGPTRWTPWSLREARTECQAKIFGPQVHDVGKCVVVSDRRRLAQSNWTLRSARICAQGMANVAPSEVAREVFEVRAGSWN